MHPVTSDEIDKRSDTFFEMDQRKNEFLATLAHELRKGFGLVFARSICVLLSLQARTIELFIFQMYEVEHTIITYKMFFTIA